jgi:hypothetical protein
VVDPAEVVRMALRDAGSIADLLITIERCASLMGSSDSGRFDPFAKSSANDRHLRERTSGVDVKGH